jgi:hypothetical protein
LFISGEKYGVVERDLVVLHDEPAGRRTRRLSAVDPELPVVVDVVAAQERARGHVHSGPVVRPHLRVEDRPVGTGAHGAFLDGVSELLHDEVLDRNAGRSGARARAPATG